MNLWQRFLKWLNFKSIREDVNLTIENLQGSIRDINLQINNAVEEIESRAENVKKEAEDVGDAITEVVDQVGDVVAAAKGKKRPGRSKKIKTSED